MLHCHVRSQRRCWCSQYRGHRENGCRTTSSSRHQTMRRPTAFHETTTAHKARAQRTAQSTGDRLAAAMSNAADPTDVVTTATRQHVCIPKHRDLLTHVPSPHARHSARLTFCHPRAKIALAAAHTCRQSEEQLQPAMPIPSPATPGLPTGTTSVAPARLVAPPRPTRWTRPTPAPSRRPHSTYRDRSCFFSRSSSLACTSCSSTTYSNLYGKRAVRHGSTGATQ